VKAPRQPLFLARQGYRRRRMIDAALLLPMLGVFLIVLPILWTPQDAGDSETAREGIYLFLVWLGLIVAAFALARGLRPVIEADAGEGGDGTGAPDRSGKRG